MSQVRDMNGPVDGQSVEGPAARSARSDDALLEGILAGCSEDFGVLYDRYFPRVYSFVHSRIRSHADAEEIVQETFIAVFRSVDRYRGTASMLSWVFGIARNLVNNHVRSTKRRNDRVALVVDEQLEREASPNAPTPAEIYELDEYRRRLLAELSELSSWQTDIFAMRHFENLSIAEISNRTLRSSDSVRSSLFRVKRLFMDRAGVDSVDVRPQGVRS